MTAKRLLILPICFLFFLGACRNDDQETSEPISILTSTVEEVQSNCNDDSGVLKSKYLEKAQLLAVRYLLEQKKMDTAVISQEVIDDVLITFYAINQATKLTNKTEILNTAIYPYPSLYMINLFLSKDSDLGQNWKENFTKTSNDTINQLLTDYGLTVKKYDTEHPSGHKITLQTSIAYNTQVIVNKFLAIKDVENANNEENSSITDDIKYSIDGKNKVLEFIKRKAGEGTNIWKYQISDDCIVKKI